MTKDELKRIFTQLPHMSVVVLGDYFLDKYLLIDPNKDEQSVETGLTAYQVVDRRLLPGAAGTVTNNLRSLGVGKVIALSIIGDDGEGQELVRGLENNGVQTDELLISNKRVTPTYTKPMRVEKEGERELNRLDIKNWSPTPTILEEKIIQKLNSLVRHADAVIIADQVTEKDHGVVTGNVREALSEIGNENPALPIIVDSRANIAHFRQVMIKPNHHEALAATSNEHAHVDSDDKEVALSFIYDAGQRLAAKIKKPVFLTHGSNGQYVFHNEHIAHVPGVKVKGPIDIVGAGDSTTAGIVSALCCGSSLTDAALLGNLVASITIQKLGTTGTATPEEILASWQEAENV